MEEKKIQQFAEIIKNNKKIVFFGGAGVSTESGLKDYRSKDGIYHTYNKYGIPPEEIISIDFFEENPQVFYDFYREFFICKAEPNSAHMAVAELEKLGKKVTVVTQNVDGLHQKAGSKNVLELHGSADKYYCANCGKNLSYSALSNNYLAPFQGSANVLGTRYNFAFSVCKSCLKTLNLNAHSTNNSYHFLSS